MIRHEARTGTIRYLTGLNDDRIRKLYTSYFKYGEAPVRRQRGRSPTRVAPLVRTPQRALESGVFANLLLANGLISVEHPPGPPLKHNVDVGHRFCECFETFESRAAQRVLVRVVLESARQHAPRRRARYRALRRVLDLLRVRRLVVAALGVPGVPPVRAARRRRAARGGRVAWRHVPHRRRASAPRRATRSSSPRTATSSTRGRRERGVVAGAPRVLGGRDLQAGGSWLAVDRRGRFAAVTNIRDPERPIGLRSRGSLVIDFLAGADAADAMRRASCMKACIRRFQPARLRRPRALACEQPHGGGGARRGIARVQQRPGRRRVAEDRERAGGNRSGCWPCGEPLVRRCLLCSPSATARAAGATLQRTHFVVGPIYGTRCSTVVLIDDSGTRDLRGALVRRGGPAGRRGPRALRARACPLGARDGSAASHAPMAPISSRQTECAIE